MPRIPLLLLAVPLEKTWLGTHYWKAPSIMDLPVELEVLTPSFYPPCPGTMTPFAPSPSYSGAMFSLFCFHPSLSPGFAQSSIFHKDKQKKRETEGAIG
ncbi:hypothetical protein EDD21DRAFT_369157 [Dissophora ornata]|nr:hypothetical protein EDD21DRAFT_369157 [Dissophora ornata]